MRVQDSQPGGSIGSLVGPLGGSAASNQICSLAFFPRAPDHPRQEESQNPPCAPFLPLPGPVNDGADFQELVVFVADFSECFGFPLRGGQTRTRNPRRATGATHLAPRGVHEAASAGAAKWRKTPLPQPSQQVSVRK